jgi:hypothetical protein
MFSELQQPGYLHVLINHLPIIGTAMGVLTLLIGLALRLRKALLPGLAIVVPLRWPKAGLPGRNSVWRTSPLGREPSSSYGEEGKDFSYGG